MISINIIDKSIWLDILLNADYDREIEFLVWKKKVLKEHPEAQEELDLLEDQFFKERYDKWLAKQPRIGKWWAREDYYDEMLARVPHIEGKPYTKPSGAVYSLEELDEMFFVTYDTKIVLYGDYIRIYSYVYEDVAMKYDFKTNKVFKYYQSNISNKRTKYLDMAFGNEKVFKTWINLQFDDEVFKGKLNEFEVAAEAYKGWVRKVKTPPKDFQCLKVVEPGTKKIKKVHYHLLTNLDIDVDSEMFVKSARKGKKHKHEYNLTNWEYGYSTAYKIRTLADVKGEAKYSSKVVNDKHFKGKKRNWTATQGLVSPKVFYYNSRSPFGQKKIEVLLKDAVVIDKFNQPGSFGSITKVKVYKRDRDGAIRAKQIEDEQEEMARMDVEFKANKDWIDHLRDIEEQEACNYEIPLEVLIEEDSDKAAAAEAWYKDWIKTQDDTPYDYCEEPFEIPMEDDFLGNDCFNQGQEVVGVYIITPGTSKKWQKQLAKDKIRFTNYCKDNNYHIYGFYIDFGYSTKTTDRPDYQKMLKDMREGKFRKLLVISVNTITDNPIDFNDFIQYFEKHNSRLEIIHNGDAFNSIPWGELAGIMNQFISTASNLNK